MLLLQYLPLLLLAVLLVQIVRLRAHVLFPWFFAYICFAVVAGVVRFIVHSHFHSYLIVYWSTDIGYNIFHLLAIYEVYLAVFRGLARTWWFHLIFPLTVMAAIAFVVMHIEYAPTRTSSHLYAVIVTSALGVQILQALMFAILVICVFAFQLYWRQYAFGITAGFGLYATVALLATTRISVFVTSSAAVWGWTQLAAYNGAVLIWLWFFRKPQKPEPLGALSEEFALRAKQELEQYLKYLRRLRG